MKDIYNGREEIAKATNTLFKIGFYFLNLGFALFILTITEVISTTQSTIEILSKKVGGFSIYLGAMLFINMYLFFREKGWLSKKEHLHKLYRLPFDCKRIIMKKKIVIAGGTGFIGKYLYKRFSDEDYEVLIISRDANHINWNNEKALTDALEGAEALINLAGKSVDCRYNERNKS